jgi:SET domain-containing protein
MKRYNDNPWIDPRIKIKPSPIHGNGMFAKSPIHQGEVVVIWGGKYVGQEEAQKARHEGKIAQQIDENTFDVYSRDEANRDQTWFMNHSCDPNVWMRDEVTLVARDEIELGEELTGDYAMWEAEEDEVKPWECKCGSSLCRKKITGKDWRKPELQHRYDRHFSPLINRRIVRSKKSTSHVP